MQLKNDFKIRAPVEHVWEVLNDVERVAPFVPGFQLQEADGDVYRGTVKVKVGAITVSYNAEIEVRERSPEEHRVVMEISGRERRGPGTMNAMVTSLLTPDGSSTQISLTTDLRLTGRVAQFGGGILGDVSKSLVTQFAQALEDGLLAPAITEATPAGGPVAGTAATAADEPRSPRAAPPQPADDTADVLDVTGALRGSLMRRVAPQAIGAATIALVFYVIGRSRA